MADQTQEKETIECQIIPTEAFHLLISIAVYHLRQSANIGDSLTSQLLIDQDDETAEIMQNHVTESE